ncbi:MAG: 2-amino-4-hydroxy-6-hydroxymethyldihydropteridine diphosphokinase [Gammaproteobacteria bacterium]|nr:MAG: 2-amino-4-hydroxy-6-hydroxymethyldihydropteridine diphosphokinase [Gammaproteobacteria bacterium]
MIDAYIGLGSNLGDSVHNLQSAIHALGNSNGIQLIRASQFYQSKAIGPGEQPDYINAALHIKTSLAPEILLDQLQAIEEQHQRQRGPVRWTARTLDLDLLLYGNRQINTARLTVPHPEIPNRNFVLLPLYDLTPSLVFPNGVCLSDLVKQSSGTGIKPIKAYPPVDFQ